MKDCRNIKVIELGKRYVNLFLLNLYTEMCTIKGSLFRLGYLCCFDLFVYTPRVFGFRTSQLVYGYGLFLIDLLYFSFYKLLSLINELHSNDSLAKY